MYIYTLAVQRLLKQWSFYERLFFRPVIGRHGCHGSQGMCCAVHFLSPSHWLRPPRPHISRSAPLARLLVQPWMAPDQKIQNPLAPECGIERGLKCDLIQYSALFRPRNFFTAHLTDSSLPEVKLRKLISDPNDYHTRTANDLI